MPKAKLPYLEAMRRFERKCERKLAKLEKRESERREQSREKRRARQDANRLVRIVHLRRQLQDVAKRPSLFTAKQLSAIAKNTDLPAEARVEAARLLSQWLFAEPEELEIGHVGRRQSRRRN